MLPGRKTALLSLYSMYKKTGIPLLGGIASCDDPGLFLYTPLVASFFGTDILTAARYVFTGISLLFTLVTVYGVHIFEKKIIKTMLPLGLLYLFFLKLLTMNDLYIAYVLPFSFLLLFIVAVEQGRLRLFYTSLFFTGLLCQIASQIRILSDLPVLLVVGCIGLLTSAFTKKQKAMGILFFLLGYALGTSYLQYAVYKKSAYSREHTIPIKQEPKHVFWHNMYIGFGFTHNKHNIVWADGCADAAAQKIESGVRVGTDLYEKIIRSLIFDLVKKDRHFVLMSLFARFGVVVMFFLLWFGWLALACAYFYPKPWYQELGFFLGLSISALPGILTLPNFQYLLGFITCTIVYTLYSYLYACNKGLFKDLKRLLCFFKQRR